MFFSVLFCIKSGIEPAQHKIRIAIIISNKSVWIVMPKMFIVYRQETTVINLNYKLMCVCVA